MTKASEKALVIGASGLVGSALMEFLGRERAVGTFNRTPIEDGIRFDLEQAVKDPSVAESLIDSVNPETVYIVAAMTFVERCQNEPQRSTRMNCDAPLVIARVARKAGIRTVYYSTDYVFDGENGPYSEEDQPQPISVYGRSKLCGELAVLDEDPDALVIRTTVLFGPEEQGKNFAYRLAVTLGAGKKIQVPQDQISTPTYSRDLARASVSLVTAGTKGVFNVTGTEVMDRVALGRRLARAVNLDENLIEPVMTAHLGQKAPRPLKAGLKIDKLLSTLPDFKPRNIEQAASHWLSHQRGKPWPS